jgi:CDP-diacylglycerol--glycerol-3-phosphate 3-phosphatidyltransferase
MNLPTKLSVLRILLTFVIMGLLFVPGWIAKAAALATFLMACLTDWLDGYLAHRWRQVTPVGALLDPIADKVLVLGLFLAFVLREFVITGVRLFAASRGTVLSAAREGKHKTVSQMATIVVVLLVLLIEEVAAPQTLSVELHQSLRWVVLGFLWATMALTVGSGASFFWRHRTVLRGAVGR